MGEVPGMDCPATGWMDSELFDLWFCHHFLAYAPPTRPALLLLDGHSSHYNLMTIKKAAEEDIVIFCLPPHFSHITQPLDKGVFIPLQCHWRQECLFRIPVELLLGMNSHSSFLKRGVKPYP